MEAVIRLFERPPRLVRKAKYAPEFLEVMRGRRFRNPDTGNEVLFESLPEVEQKRIHDYWMRVRQRQQTGEKPKPKRNIPEEALQSTDLVSNQDPDRYREIEFEYGHLGDEPEQVKKELHAIVGDAAKEAGMTPEQFVLDAAGAGGAADQLTSVKITASRLGRRAAVFVEGSGKHVHQMERQLSFGNGQLESVENKALELSEDAPEGTGTRMLATQVATLQKAGAAYIKTVGAGCPDCDYVGYYVWPLLGFDGAIPPQDVDQMPTELQRDVIDMAGGHAPEIGQLMSFDEGRKWWRENGSEIELEFDLDNDSVLVAYLQKKAEKAGKTLGQFIHNASKKPRGKSKGSDKVEQAPKLTKEDQRMLGEIWDGQRKNRKGKTMTNKNATSALVDLAKENSGFRSELLAELVKESKVKDFAIDEFSQHNLLKNLRGGDLVEINFKPEPLHPERIATRLVDSDFDPSIPGVLLRGIGEQQEILADRGQDMPLIWEPGSGEPAIPVLKLRIVRSTLRLGQKDDGKATADQVQFALDLAEEKGKDYSKSDLQSKSKAEISKMIEDMQKEETKASEKQVSYALDLLKADGKSSPNKSSLEKMSEVEVSKLIDKLKKSAHKVAEEIIELMGGRHKLASLLGARNLELSKEGIAFEWPNRQASKGNKITIRQGPAGTYDMFFFNKDASEDPLHEIRKVYPEQLASCFEKQTGWFLRV